MTTITIPALPSETAPIDDASYMILSQTGASKKMTVAQFLAKISSQNQGFINNFLGSSDEAAARANLAIDRRTTVSDADYTIVNTDKVVSQIGVMSAPRLFSLPAASTFPAGAELIILDESGSVTSLNKITVQRNGTDTIEGATSKEIKSAYGFLALISDGTGSWKVIGVDAPKATTVVAGLSYLPKQITISNNFGTPASKIDFTAGNFQFYDGSGQGAMTAKTGDMVNLFGTSDGMLDVGTVAEDTYSLFTVYNPTTGDSKPLASLSATTPDMTEPNLDGYTVLSARIGSLLTDSFFQIITNSVISINSQNSNIPAFKATMSGDQTVTTGVTTKVQFAVRNFDTNNGYDSTNYRFTPPVTGWYSVLSNLSFLDTGPGAFSSALEIRKNGSTVAVSSSRFADNGAESLNVNSLIYLDGSSDYLEVWATIGGSGSDTFVGNFSDFQALRIF